MAPASCTLIARILLIRYGLFLNIKCVTAWLYYGRDWNWSFVIDYVMACGIPRGWCVIICSCLCLDCFIRVPWHVPNRLPVNPLVVKPPGSSWPPRRPGRVRRLQVESRSPTDTGEKYTVYICLYRSVYIVCAHVKTYIELYMLA